MDELKKQYSALVAALAEYKNLAGQVAARMSRNRSNYPVDLQTNADAELSLYDTVVNKAESALTQVKNYFGDELGQVSIIAGAAAWLATVLSAALAYITGKIVGLKELLSQQDFYDRQIASGATPEEARAAVEAVKPAPFVSVKAGPTFALGSLAGIALALGLGYLILKAVSR